jgi:methylated-DNA-protein-cysteine methyltransferase-like protein
VQEFSNRVIVIIKNIPRGKVLTYGLIAGMAGSARGARQVSRLLHSGSRKYNLPWHRVINSRGTISLPQGKGFEEQKKLLMSEGVKFRENDTIDLNEYLWKDC